MASISTSGQLVTDLRRLVEAIRNSNTDSKLKLRFQWAYEFLELKTSSLLLDDRNGHSIAMIKRAVQLKEVI
jgi:hypothetical protein